MQIAAVGRDAEDSLGVRGWDSRALTIEALRSVPGQGTVIPPQASQHVPKRKKKKKGGGGEMLRDDTGTEYADSIPGKGAWSQASSGQDVEELQGSDKEEEEEEAGTAGPL